MNLQDRKREDQHLCRLDECDHGEAEHVAEDDLAATQRACHQALERPLGSLVEEGDDRDHEHKKEHDQADERRAEVIERVVALAAVEVLDLGLEVDVAARHLGRERDHRLLQRLKDGCIHPRLRAFEVDLGRDVAVLRLAAEIGRQHDVGDERTVLEPGIAVRRADVGGRDVARMPERIRHHDAQRTGILVGDTY